jgi:SAM-dependent methyltransferase
MRVPDDWFVGFHNGLVARFWAAAGQTMIDEDERVVRALLPVGSVLDVPCGDGRLSARLAAAGYDVTGVDVSAEAVGRARATGAHARFLEGDLRALPDGPFDGVLSWGNSFGYLTPAETVRSLAEFRRVLRPGGRLVLESMTVAEAILPAGIDASRELEFGGVTMRATNTYRAAESRLESEYEFEADGAIEHASAAHHVHTTGEVVRLLRGAGFDDVELRGPDGVRSYELGDKRLIALAA